MCFLARDPIMEYCNWERSQKQQEGEAERKEGHREEKHGGTEAFGRARSRSLSLGLDPLGSEGGAGTSGRSPGAEERRDVWESGVGHGGEQAREGLPGPSPSRSHSGLGTCGASEEGPGWGRLADGGCSSIGPQHPRFTERETEDRGRQCSCPGHAGVGSEAPLGRKWVLFIPLQLPNWGGAWFLRALLM